MSGDELAQDPLGLVEALFFEIDNAEQRGAALGDRVDLREVLGGFDDIVEETVVKRLEDRLVKGVRLLAGFFELGEENLGAPLLACDVELPTIAVENPDHVWVLRGVGGGRGLAGGWGGGLRLERQGTLE
ncbi:MAG: hypothetical protein BWX86_01016 [Verrucomicrobia bacterium ADurb.Bin122]|nr:MAG: hypothetical protein BWX86_01016 [Verrucomicrobia bacterium ADurb.Bin122]